MGLALVAGVLGSGVAVAVEPSPSVAVLPGQTLHLTSEDSASTVEAAIDGGSLVEVVDGELAAPDREGDYWLVTVARNPAGVVSAPKWVKVRVDATAPDLELGFEPEPVESAGRRWLPPGASAELRATDAVAGVAESWLAAAGRRAEGVEAVRLELPFDGGEVEIGSGASDAVGNRTADAAATVWVDARPPTGAIAMEGPKLEVDGRLVTAAAIELIASAEDDESGLQRIERSLDGEPTGTEGWQSPFTAGDHRAEATITDRVGNRSVVPLAFTVDDRPPTIEWSVGSDRSVERDGVTYHSRPVTVTASAHDRLAGLDSLEFGVGGEWRAWEGSTTSTDESLSLRAMDRVANRAETTAQWEIDDLAPVMTLVAPDGSRHPPDERVEIVAGQRLTIEAAEAESGIESFETSYRLRGWFRDLPFRAGGAVDIVYPGGYFVYARATDRLGNEANVRWSVKVLDRGGR